MELLPLPVIGWLYTIASALALALGAVLVVHANRAGGHAREQLARRRLEDSLLFGIWLIGLAGGIGLLLGKAWSALALEFFSWVLIGLTLFSVIARSRAIRGGEGAPGMPAKALRIFNLALFALPIIALCAATILSLRSEATIRALSGS